MTLPLHIIASSGMHRTTGSFLCDSGECSTTVFSRITTELFYGARLSYPLGPSQRPHWPANFCAVSNAGEFTFWSGVGSFGDDVRSFTVASPFTVARLQAAEGET